MSYLDDYVEKIHYLPLDVNRNLRLIQELDKRATKAKDLLERFQEDLQKSLQTNGVMLPNKKGYNFNEEQKYFISCIDKTQTEYYHLCEEKCKVSDQIYQEIQLQHDELNNETKRFVGENPQLKANLQNQSPIAQQTIQDNDFIPTQLKKKKKNEEKKAQKIKDANDFIDSTMNSPIKGRNIGGDSPIRSFQEGHGYSNQYNQGNSSYISFGKQYGSASNIDKLDSIKSNNTENLKSSKRQTKSKYASSNRQEEQKYCCGQKIESSYLQCDGCNSWFHHSCLGFEQNYLPQEDWYCSKCKGDVDTYSATSFSVGSKLAPSRSNGNSSVRKSKLSNN